MVLRPIYGDSGDNNDGGGGTSFFLPRYHKDVRDYRTTVARVVRRVAVYVTDIVVFFRNSYLSENVPFPCSLRFEIAFRFTYLTSVRVSCGNILVFQPFMMRSPFQSRVRNFVRSDGPTCVTTSYRHVVAVYLRAHDRHIAVAFYVSFNSPRKSVSRRDSCTNASLPDCRCGSRVVVIPASCTPCRYLNAPVDWHGWPSLPSVQWYRFMTS